MLAALAMGIADKIGGDPALTVVLVILTGIIGALQVPLAGTFTGIALLTTLLMPC